MMFILFQTLLIGLISFVVFIALYVLTLVIMNFAQMKKDRTGLFNYNNK